MQEDHSDDIVMDLSSRDELLEGDLEGIALARAVREVKARLRVLLEAVDDTDFSPEGMAGVSERRSLLDILGSSELVVAVTGLRALLEEFPKE